MIDRKAMKKMQDDMFGQRKQITTQPTHITNALKIANADEEKRAERSNAQKDLESGI